MGCVMTSDLYLFQEIVLFNPCFKFSKYLMLLLIDKVTNGKLSLVLLIWNVAPVADSSRRCSAGGLAFALVAISVLWYFRYFRYYAIPRPWQIKCYFTVN